MTSPRSRPASGIFRPRIGNEPPYSAGRMVPSTSPNPMRYPSP
jgi:hypothetical protein